MRRGEDTTRTNLVLPAEGLLRPFQGGQEVDHPHCERTTCTEQATLWDGNRWLCKRHYDTATCPSRIQTALRGYRAPDIQLTTDEANTLAARIAALPDLRAENDRLRVSETQLRLELRDTQIVVAVIGLLLVIVAWFR